MFELTTPTNALLKTFSPRVEKHGEDEVSAATLGLRIIGANTLLDLLQPGLRTMLYTAPEGQESLPGVEPSTPLLRAKGVESVKLAACFEGWTLKIDHGIDERDPFVIGGSKVDKFVVVPKEGGTVEIDLRVGSSDIDESEAGWLYGRQRQDISITLHAPKAPAAAIDGSTEAFKADHPGAADGQADLLDGGQDAGEAFADAHGGPDDEGGTDSEGGATDADDGAAEQAEIEAGMRESLAAAGLREKPARRGRKVAAVE